MKSEVLRLSKRAMTICKSRYSSDIYWKATLKLLTVTLSMLKAIVPTESLTISGTRARIDDERQQLESMVAEAGVRVHDCEAEEDSRMRADEGSLTREDVRTTTSSYQYDMGGGSTSRYVPNLETSSSGALVGLDALLSQLMMEIEDTSFQSNFATSDEDIINKGKKPAAAKGAVLSLRRKRIHYTCRESDEANNSNILSSQTESLPAASSSSDAAHTEKQEDLNENSQIKEPSDESVPLLPLSCTLTCHICYSEFAEGTVVVSLPCHETHCFHRHCIEKWLLEHSCCCPICRHELPTDDTRYEGAKERERERVMAENAVKGGEFMYM